MSYGGLLYAVRAGYFQGGCEPEHQGVSEGGEAAEAGGGDSP